MTTNDKSPGMLIARLDRITVWSLPGLFIGIIGVGFLFTFYDIFDINVSFIPDLHPDCPELHTAFGGKLYRPAGAPESRRLCHRDLDPESTGRSCRTPRSSARDHGHHWPWIDAHGLGRQLHLVRQRARLPVSVSAPTSRSSTPTSTRWHRGKAERVILRSSFFFRRWARCSASGLVSG